MAMFHHPPLFTSRGANANAANGRHGHAFHHHHHRRPAFYNAPSRANGSFAPGAGNATGHNHSAPPPPMWGGGAYHHSSPAAARTRTRGRGVSRVSRRIVAGGASHVGTGFNGQQSHLGHVSRSSSSSSNSSSSHGGDETSPRMAKRRRLGDSGDDADAFDSSVLASNASPQSDSSMCTEQQLHAKLAQAAAKFAKQSHELATLRAANDSLKVANTRLANRVHWSPKLLSGLKANELKALKDGVLEEEERRRRCVICLTEEATHVVLPCWHMCLCEQCESKIRRSGVRQQQRCPKCRVQIECTRAPFKD